MTVMGGGGGGGKSDSNITIQSAAKDQPDQRCTNMQQQTYWLMMTGNCSQVRHMQYVINQTAPRSNVHTEMESLCLHQQAISIDQPDELAKLQQQQRWGCE